MKPIRFRALIDHIMRKKSFVLLIALLPLSHCAMANTEKGDGSKEPGLTGSVSDASSRRPVEGVTVSIKSAKDRTEKLITTDASGKFRIPKIPAGEVTIILEKKGYRTYRREKVVVKEGTQLQLDFDLKNLQEVNENDVFHPLQRMMES